MRAEGGGKPNGSMLKRVEDQSGHKTKESQGLKSEVERMIWTRMDG